MSGALNNALNIAMTAALVDTYEKYDPDFENKKINILLVQLQIACEKALSLWEKIDSKVYKRVDKKISTMKDISYLGQPDSIVTYLDFSIAIIEPIIYLSKFDRACAIKNIITILSFLREEFLLCFDDTDDYECSKRAIICKEQWSQIEL